MQIVTNYSKRNTMKNSLQLLTAMLILVGLSSCGGGGEDGGDAIDYYTPPSYGSIAINSTTKAAGITANYGSQSDANSQAKNSCGAGCTTALEFGSFMCGALARGTNGVIGWASNGSKSNAESTSVSQCTSRGGAGCGVLLSECNSS